VINRVHKAVNDMLTWTTFSMHNFKRLRSCADFGT